MLVDKLCPKKNSYFTFVSSRFGPQRKSDTMVEILEE